MKHVIDEILEELRYQGRGNDSLWDADDIARYMRLSKSTVQGRIICRESFPLAVRLPTSDTGLGGRRWLAKEVKQWVMRHREPARRSRR
ncbi:helix-turn-helix transcriptional regulator [Celerinatantimonas sp. MCCC 1A17872]|uniref:helix-turn-helix transcriptional regulator n=1 Tax=Celerinatantimonas sp. MCCC 1A17872 TaxID=3177514 RepID=UPI0038C10599